MPINEHLVVSMGERCYRIERPWGELPDDIQFGVLSSLAVDSKGNV